MPSLAADIRLMLAGDFAESAVIGGVTVRCDASVATADDTLGGEGIIQGRTLVLSLASADCPGIKPRAAVTFRGQAWAVNHLQLRAQGALTRIFLGAP